MAINITPVRDVEHHIYTGMKIIGFVSLGFASSILLLPYIGLGWFIVIGVSTLGIGLLLDWFRFGTLYTRNGQRIGRLESLISDLAIEVDRRLSPVNAS